MHDMVSKIKRMIRNTLEAHPVVVTAALDVVLVVDVVWTDVVVGVVCVVVVVV